MTDYGLALKYSTAGLNEMVGILRNEEINTVN